MAELDGLRAVAVIAVVSYHVCVLLPSQANALGPIGARGVDLFFVISGFCLTWPYDNAPRIRDVPRFLVRRLTRIAPTFYAALGVFALLALTPFGLPSHGHPVGLAVQAGDVLRDMAFFPSLNPIHDPVVWTLGVEMRWYVLFPLLLIVYYRSRLAFLAIAVAAHVIDQMYGIPDAGILPCFMLGVVAAQLTKRRRRSNVLWLPVAIVLLVVAVAEQTKTALMDHRDILWQLAMFAFVLSVTTDPRLRRVFSHPALNWCGVASFSIYLIHQPFLDAMARAGVPVIAAAACSVGIGVVFWYVVERPLCSVESRAAMHRALATFGRKRTSAGEAYTRATV